MSDQLFRNKNKEIEELKNKEKTESKFRTSSAPVHELKENEFAGIQNEEIREKVQKDFEITGVINQPSNIALNNLKKIEEGQNPVLDTRYVYNEEGYQEKYDSESLENLRTEFQQDRYKKKGFLWGYRSDSGEMKAIQSKLAELTTQMYDREFMLSETKMVEDVFEVYRNIIGDCNTYLGSSTKGYSQIGKLRRSMVERIRTTCMRELNILPQIIDSERKAQEKAQLDFPVSFAYLLRKARSVQLSEDSNNKFQITGGVQSTIIKYKQGDKTYFFKEDDTHIKHNNKTIINTLKEEQKTFITAGKLNEKDCEEVVRHTEALFSALDADVKNGVISEDLKKKLLTGFYFASVPKRFAEDYNLSTTNEEKETVLNAAKKTLEKNLLRDPEIKEELTRLYNMDGQCNFTTYLKNTVITDMLKSNTRLNAYMMSFSVVGKTAFSDSFLSNKVKLPVGAKITTNNVATSRLAAKLNISDIVAKSQSAIININGKTLVGNTMEEAKGTNLSEVGRLYEYLKSEVDSLGTLTGRYKKSAAVINSWNEPKMEEIRKRFRNAIMNHRDTLKDYDVEAALKNHKDMYELALKIPGYKDIPEINDYVKGFKAYESAVENCKKNEEIIFNKLKMVPELYKPIQDIVKKDKKDKEDKEDKEEKKLTVQDIIESYEKIRKIPDKLIPYYSGEAKRQLMCLGILDFIMGQIDRHQGNFFVTTEVINGRTVITGVKAIDNDACCGLLKPKDLVNEKTAHQLGRLEDEKGNVLVPYMDGKLAGSILNLTVEDLTHEMIDLLSKEQIAAMAERLKYVQNLILSEYGKGKTKKNTMKFIEKKEDWDKVGETPYDREALDEYNPHFFTSKLSLTAG